MPTLLLQIIWPDGTVVRSPAGGKFEKKLIADVAARVAKKKVGILTTQAQASERVREALEESFAELKERTLQGFE